MSRRDEEYGSGHGHRPRQGYHRESRGGGYHDEQYGGEGSYGREGRRYGDDRYGGGGGGGEHGYRGRGGGGRGGRGGRGRGGDRNKNAMSRYHGKASRELIKEVEELNANDSIGPQFVRVWKYENCQWIKVESLSKGGYYYYNEFTKETKEAAEQPKEIIKAKLIETTAQRQGVKFPTPPKVNWEKVAKNETFRIIEDLKSNSFPIIGDLLKKEIHHYIVEFEPAIKTSDSLRRREVILGRQFFFFFFFFF
ncbi:hypothetical protein RFI_12797 [Reticulomyxa filosa]|uniref:Uncharacterized protein n=1 Tax=Reticulomyxa filosa TaxID=46433 RepID=X6NF31_RETFI|nr:hypothetical protein RFI_12797 [Reticulomyxa filosa]|eukprot:ETO24359.1 hypothetical protein RFI_12797 [Reticulomyxa filosa]